MDRDFIKKALLIPILTGIVIGVLFTVAFSDKINATMPFNEGAQLAVHEQLTLGDGEAAASVKEAQPNTAIGATINGKELVKDADYALLNTCVSVRTGSNEFDETGCRYLKTLNCFADDFTDTVTVVHDSGSRQSFAFVEDYSVDSEQEALAVAPPFSSSLVIYYQDREGAGLSTAYHVMIYEEVA